MKYLEYGKGNKELVVMLHGGGVSYQGMEPTPRMMADPGPVRTKLGHGGLAGGQPERFLEEMRNTHEAQEGM